MWPSDGYEEKCVPLYHESCPSLAERRRVQRWFDHYEGRFDALAVSSSISETAFWDTLVFTDWREMFKNHIGSSSLSEKHHVNERGQKITNRQ
jgi:hypothetical protein